MNVHRKRHPGSMLLIILVLGALLGGCGAEQPTGSTANTASGVVTVGTPTAGLNTCMSCHPGTTAEWETTRHANLNSSPSSTSASCAVCHDQLGDRTQLTPNRNVVGCESCHGPGSLHAAQGGMGPIGYAASTSSVLGTVPVSAQFMTCTFCHELLDSAGTPSVGPKSPAFHQTGAAYNILDTHFASPGTWSNSSGASSFATITGYAMDYADEKVCSNCHNPHGTADINREWAASRHADRDGTRAWSEYNWTCSGVTPTSCGKSGANNNDRRPCQRCHTTTGYIAFNNALVSGDSALAQQIDAGSVTAVAFTTEFKPERLECNGCHSDNRGTMRNPGAYTADYTLGNHTNPDAVATFTFPDISSSNVCITCHSSRMSGESIKNVTLTGPTVTTFGNMSFVDSHYLSAGGTIFKATGYGFGRNYEDPASYRHKDIGTSSVSNTGSGGPCVGCHMYRSGAAASHLFRVVGKDTAGSIVSVVSEVCYNCHAGSSSGLADIIDKERIEFEDALSALTVVLDKKGISYNAAAYPYVYQQRTAVGTVSVTNGSPIVTEVTGSALWTAATITSTDFFRVEVDGSAYGIQSVDSDTQITLTTAYTGPSVSGAAYVIFRGGRSDGVKNWLFGGTEEKGRNNHGATFNLQLLVHDPGAYVHNSKYVKRLLYDSIDWIDDGVLNYSVGATLNALPAITAFKSEAMRYLLPSGYISGNVPAERP